MLPAPPFAVAAQHICRIDACAQDGQTRPRNALSGVKPLFGGGHHDGCLTGAHQGYLVTHGVKLADGVLPRLRARAQVGERVHNKRNAAAAGELPGGFQEGFVADVDAHDQIEWLDSGSKPGA